MKHVILLESIHQVIRAEKFLKGRGMPVDLVPVPREISSDCGMALELPGELGGEAVELLRNQRIPVRDWYTKDEAGRFHKEGGAKEGR